MFVEFRARSTLSDEESTVYDYVTTIHGRLYTFGDDDEKVPIGRIRAWKIHLERIEADGQDPWEVLDAEHGELEALYSAVFDRQSGHFKPAVLRAAELVLPPSHIVVIHTVEIEEAHRGRRLSMRLMDRTMDAFGSRDGMAALFPYPLGMRGMKGHRIKRSQRRLSTYWHSAGFQPIPGSDWLVRNGANLP